MKFIVNTIRAVIGFVIISPIILLYIVGFAAGIDLIERKWDAHKERAEKRAKIERSEAAKLNREGGVK